MNSISSLQVLRLKVTYRKEWLVILVRMVGVFSAFLQLLKGVTQGTLLFSLFTNNIHTLKTTVSQQNYFLFCENRTLKRCNIWTVVSTTKNCFSFQQHQKPHFFQLSVPQVCN